MRDERGFTLVEMLVGLSILGVVSGALVVTLAMGMRTADDTRVRVGEARDAQLVASYFMADAQSAVSVSTSDQTCAGQAPIVRFRWTDEGSQKDVAYVARTVGTERRLSRMVCVGGGAATTIDVAHALSPTVAPAVSCPGGCNGSPARMTLNVTEASGYTFSVAASRRAS